VERNPERQVPRPRRGFDAVEAAVAERDLRERLDEPDASFAAPGRYDLRAAGTLAGERARRAAASDVYTSDEALADVAGQGGLEVPDDTDDDEYEHA
jgi:hypothetical protein